MAWLAGRRCAGILLAVLCAVCMACATEERVSVKVIKGPPRGASVEATQEPRPPIPSRNPDLLSGPEELYMLDGSCFSVADRTYEYTVCPFQNVTQKAVHTSWTSFYGLLGVWGEWRVKDDQYASMHYTDGTPCHGSLSRSITVDIQCGPANLDMVQEPDTCVYRTTLYVPEACDADMSVPREVLDMLRSMEEAEVAAADGSAAAGGEGVEEPPPRSASDLGFDSVFDTIHTIEEATLGYVGQSIVAHRAEASVSVDFAARFRDLIAELKTQANSVREMCGKAESESEAARTAAEAAAELE